MSEALEIACGANKPESTSGAKSTGLFGKEDRRVPRRRRVPRPLAPATVKASVLPGGRVVRVREASSEDAERLRRMFLRLSLTSIYRRFHAPYPWVPERAITHAAEAGDGKLSLVALVGGEIVGQAMYVRLAGADEAEAAVVVEDGWQRHGIGSLLLSRLAWEARKRGIGALTGAVLHENGAMRALLAGGSVATRYSKEDGVHLAHAPLLAPDPAPDPAEQIHRICPDPGSNSAKEQFR